MHVRTGAEPLIADYLAQRNIGTFLPTFTEIRRYTKNGQRRHEKPEVQRALFPGYLFARFDTSERAKVLQTPGVFELLRSESHEPVAVRQEEIDRVRRMVESKVCEPWPIFPKGQKVEIVDGPLKGSQGVVLRQKDSLRVVIHVEILNRMVVSKVERYMVRARSDANGRK